MSYSLLKIKKFVQGEYSIIPVRVEDRLPIMHWRNDQLDILRQTNLLTEQAQNNYFDTVVVPQFSMTQPPQLLFSFMHNNELIGYGGIVHIHWVDKRGEVSFLLSTERNRDVEVFKSEYGVFLNLVKQLAFVELKFNKITTEAFDLRPYVTETLEKNGFVLEGVLKKHNLIKGEYVDSLLHSCFA